MLYTFNNPELGGNLVSISDHDGNSLTVQRDANDRVKTVTDTSGRIYTFTYGTNNYLSRVTDFSGRYVEYKWESISSPSQVRLNAIKDVRGYTTTFNYTIYGSGIDAKSYLTSIVDPLGITARNFGYENTVYGNWGVTSTTDALSNKWNIAYCAKQPDGSCGDWGSATSFQTTTVNPLGESTKVYFDTAGRFFEKTDARGNVSRITKMPLANISSRTYNLAALPTKNQSALGVLDQTGFGTSFSYTPDNSGNLATLTDAEKGTITPTWLSGTVQSDNLIGKNLYRIKSLTTSTPGAIHSFTYDNSGKVLSYTPPVLTVDGLPTMNLYDNAGQLTDVTDGRNNRTNREYDVYGNLTKVTTPDSYFEQYFPDSLGRVHIVKDKRGNNTTYNWDAAGYLTSVVNAKLDRIDYAYDENGNCRQMIDANRNVTNYTYNPNNRLTNISKVDGTKTYTTTYNYDELGRIKQTINANFHDERITYDANNNVLSRSNALTYSTQYKYDSDNRVIQIIDPENRITDFTYDKVGRVLTVTTAVSTSTPLTTRYQYDGDGHMTSNIDTRGKITLYDYDAAGHLVKVTDPNLKVTHANYDVNGNVLSVIDPNNSTTVYTYDKLNRPQTRTDANGQQWAIQYDENGNVKSSTVPGIKTTTYTYDELNMISRADYPDASFVTYTYDANGNRLTMTDSTGTTRYYYDGLDRMTSKIDPLGKSLSYTYDDIGNVKSLTYPGGQKVNYNYDAGEHLHSLTDWLTNTTVYTLNKSGQVTAALFGNNSRADMEYDASGRMTSLINKKADNSVISSHIMTLDGNGNITNVVQQLPLQPSLSNINRVFTYDSANRLATYNGNAVTHDVAGRITDLGGATFNYNDRDQIIGITGNQAANYVYNGEGHRVMRNINGQITRFVIDPNRSQPEVLAEVDVTGAVQRNYVYGYGLVEQIDSVNASSYYHFDPTGSTLALTNFAGVVTDSYAYTPYGEITANGNTANPFRFVGKLGIMDDGNGMQYMRARYYRPDVARFMSMDAIEGTVNTPQSLNRYAYVQGNPVMREDPSGLLFEYGSSSYKAANWLLDKIESLKKSDPIKDISIFRSGISKIAPIYVMKATNINFHKELGNVFSRGKKLLLHAYNKESLRGAVKVGFRSKTIRMVADVFHMAENFDLPLNQFLELPNSQEQTLQYVDNSQIEKHQLLTAFGTALDASSFGMVRGDLRFFTFIENISGAISDDDKIMQEGYISDISAQHYFYHK